MSKMAEIRLTSPLEDNEIRNLKIADLIYLNGPIFTGMSRFHMRFAEENILPLVDFKKINVLMHVGPVMEQTDREWRPVNVAPAPSILFEKYGPAVIRNLGLKAIIGKTTMGRESMVIMKEIGCVHLTSVGVMGNTLTSQVKRVLDVHFFDELGMAEATWVIEFEDAGPFIVSIDTHGENIFHTANRKVQEKLKDFYAKYDISEDFAYTDINP